MSIPPLDVAVIAGGPSSEAAVSARSAEGVCRALQEAGHRVSLHQLSDKLPMALVAAHCQVAFPVTHGPVGEDGCLQGLLEVLAIPYVGSGVLASAIAAHKPTAKLHFRNSGLPVAVEEEVHQGNNLRQCAERIVRTMGRSLIVKPSSGGSAIGITRVLPEPATPAEPILVQALQETLATGDSALVERLHVGLEVTCGVLDEEQGPRALPPTLVHSQAADWYDFASRYKAGGSRHECPAPLGEAGVIEVQRLAVLAHQAVGARDLSRVDFVYGPEPIVLEVNTLPGMTSTSNYPEAAAIAGFSFPELCSHLVARAVARPVREIPAVVAIPE